MFCYYKNWFLSGLVYAFYKPPNSLTFFAFIHSLQFFFWPAQCLKLERWWWTEIKFKDENFKLVQLWGGKVADAAVKNEAGVSCLFSISMRLILDVPHVTQPNPGKL